MKSAKTCLLIIVLGSYLTPYRFSSVTLFAIYPVAFWFTMMLRRGCLIAHIYCIILYYISHLSYNKSAKFLILNVYFVEDNHKEKEDKIK